MLNRGQALGSLACYARSCLRPWHRGDHLDAQLRRLIDHAYRRVPFYRSRFDDCGLRPSDIRGIDDLQRVPLTNRKDIKTQELSRLITRGLDPQTLVARETHGSTGEALWVRRTWFEERLLQAHRRRVLHRLGMGPRDRRALLFYPSNPQPTDRQYLHRMAQRLGLLREVKIDSTQNFETILDALRRFNPDVLGGYPNVLLEVGKLIDARRTEGIRPRMVLTAGDASSIQLRDRLRHLYGAPVYDIYACHEVNLIAAQCRAAAGYHLSTETVIVEVLKDGRPARPGESGEIVCTALFSFAMPFIRYRLNDIVVLGSGECSCGNPGPIIDRVQGRVVDYFPLKDGRLIHPYQIVDACLDRPWILRYQIEQHSEEDIRIILASDAPPSGQEVERVRRKLAAYLGPEIRCVLRVQRRIPASPGGKHVNYRSLIYKP
jgi:phenylacetate-CoA ligase